MQEIEMDNSGYQQKSSCDGARKISEVGISTDITSTGLDMASPRNDIVENECMEARKQSEALPNDESSGNINQKMTEDCKYFYTNKEINEHVNDETDKINELVDDEKENMNAAGVLEAINKSQQLFREAKINEDALDESKELEEIKDQVRMLQQQQMYQVQMLNYLHFQLTVMASNPQVPKTPSGMFQPSGLSGLHLQNMPHLLAAAASMAGSGAPISRQQSNGIIPSMAAAISRQLSSNKTAENSKENSNETNNMADRKSDYGGINGEGILSKSHNLKPSDAYNPLSSLAMLQRSSSNIQPNGSELFCKMSSESAETTTDDVFMKHICRFCQKVFGSDSALEIHLRSHTGERPFKCNICANRFSTKGNLKVHFVRHNEKYPHIEMNSNPVPEYLDNVPTSSGIPYGMSLLPDAQDSFSTAESQLDKDLPEERKPLIEYPTPLKSADLGKLSELPQTSRDSDDSEDSRSANLRLDEEKLSPVQSVNERSELEQNDTNKQKESSAPSAFSMFPFSKPLLSEAHTQNAGARLLASIGSNVEPDKPKTECSGATDRFSGQPDHEISGSKPITSSSETTKLQRLVEQIDRGKELEKNECHICHRVLSCQSALKLHYRTHTGERPYKCDLCSRAFTTRGNLRTHYSSVHRQQLRNSPSDGGSAMRGNALQCPLCGSRFMDQQSIHQHMQMHLYMHTQQQQQAAHVVNGNGPHIDYRMLGIMGGSFRPNVSANFDRAEAKDIDRHAPENDDVFEENSSERNESPKVSEDGSRGWDSPASKSATTTTDGHLDGERSKNRQSPVTDKIFSEHTLEEKQQNKGESAALDLTRPASNGSSSSVDVRREMSPTSQTANTNLTPPPVNSSLTALAHLASSSSIMRQNGVNMMSLQMSPTKEEARLRKMTTACDICGKPFTCQSALEIHLRSHTKERPFVCRICERGFTTKGNLKQHLLTHNITDVDDEMLEPVTSPINNNSNSCSPVGSPTLHNTSQFIPAKRPLEASQSAPAPKRSYPRHWCHICQKQFSSASSLQIHNRTHTGEKPFACSVCGRAFTTKGNLKVHMGTHVWGAGGSRRGRRISMDNPLISPWMQNTSTSNAVNPPLRPRVPPQIPSVPDAAALYQQYAALASGLIGAKSDARFASNPMLNFNNAAAARLLMPNSALTASPTATSADQPLAPALKDSNGKTMAAAATEWIWKAYQRTQEQVN